MADSVSKRSVIYDIIIDTGGAKKGAQEAAQGVKQFGDELEKAATKGQRLTTHLRDLKDQLAKEDFGSEKFTKLSVEAAKVQDQIEKVNQRVRNLASNTRHIDALISAAQGLAGAFAVVQGASALLGKENEDLQKALLKVQASIAILNGLQQVQQTLMTESAAKTAIATTAQKAYNLVVGQSAGAMKIFRIALASTGLGLVVIALGSLIANFDKVKEKVTEMFPILKNFGDLWTSITDGFWGFIEATVEGFKISGELISDFFTFDWDELEKDWEEAGERLWGAFRKGVQKEQAARDEQDWRDRIAGSIKLHKRELALLEAQGKDTFDKRMQILDEEISLLKQGSDEFIEKYNEIEIEKAKRKKEIDDRIKKENATDILFDKDAFEKQQNDISSALQNFADKFDKAPPIKPQIDNSAITETGKALMQASGEAATFGEIMKDNKGIIIQSSEEILQSLIQLSQDGSKAQLAFAGIAIFANQAKALSAAIAAAAEAAGSTGGLSLPVLIPSFVSIALGTFAQVNALLAQAKSEASNINSFFEGTEYLERGNNPKGKDTIPIWANEGEAIIPTDKNAQYPGVARAMIEGNLDEFIASRWINPSLAVKAVEHAREDSRVIDYSEKFYRQLLAVNEGNHINKKAVHLLSSIDRKIGGNFPKTYGRD